MLTRAGQDAAELLDSDQDELRRLLDRITAFAAMAIEYERKPWLRRAVAAFERIYELGFDERGFDRTGPAVVWLWLDIITPGLRPRWARRPQRGVVHGHVVGRPATRGRRWLRHPDHPADHPTILFDGNDQLLADAMNEMIRLANKEGFTYNGWDGWESPVVAEFIRTHGTPES